MLKKPASMIIHKFREKNLVYASNYFIEKLNDRNKFRKKWVFEGWGRLSSWISLKNILTRKPSWVIFSCTCSIDATIINVAEGPKHYLPWLHWKWWIKTQDFKLWPHFFGKIQCFCSLLPHISIAWKNKTLVCFL